MQSPSFLPETLAKIKADSDEALFNQLKYKLNDLADYFEYGVSDHEWAIEHPRFFQLTLRWFSKMYYLNRLPVYLANIIVEMIQKNYKFLDPFLTFRPSLFFTITFFVQEQKNIVNSFLYGVSSQYFNEIFREQCYEKFRDFYVLHLSKENFDIINEHICNGTVDTLWKLSENEIIKIMQLSKQYQLHKLQEECAQVLIRYFTKENIVEAILKSHHENFIFWKNEAYDYFNKQGFGFKFEVGEPNELKVIFEDFRDQTIELFQKFAPYATHLTFSGHLSENSYYGKLIQQCPKLIGISLTGSLNYSDQFDDLPIHLLEINLSESIWLNHEHIKELSNLLPGIRQLNLGRNLQLNYQTWGLLNRFSELHELNLMRCTQIDDQDLHLIAQACPKLLKISIEDCRRITDEGIHQLIQLCQNLEVLNLSGTLITDISLEELGLFAYNVRSVFIKNCTQMSEQGLIKFLNLRKSLQYINIKSTKIDLISIIKIKKRFPLVDIEY